MFFIHYMPWNKISSHEPISGFFKQSCRMLMLPPPCISKVKMKWLGFHHLKSVLSSTSDKATLILQFSLRCYDLTNSYIYWQSGGPNTGDAGGDAAECSGNRPEQGASWWGGSRGLATGCRLTGCWTNQQSRLNSSPVPVGGSGTKKNDFNAHWALTIFLCWCQELFNLCSLICSVLAKTQ